MNKSFLILSFILLLMSCKEKPTYIEFETSKGDIILKLYDETPLHKENFIKLVEEGYYDGVLFHRVISEFMIQAGDPNSKNAKPGQMIGSGGPDYTIPGEFVDSLFHKRGALAAASDGNPQKASAGSQFYIVDGKKFTDKELESIEKRNDITYTDDQKEIYKTIGGYAPLDNKYTVFGEVVVGLDVVDEISNVDTNRMDRPTDDIKILKAEVVKFKPKKYK